MPWSAEDAKRHKKGLSGGSSSKWADIANSVLGRTGNEGMAVRVANSRTKVSGEAVKRHLKRKNITGGTYSGGS